MRAMNPESRLEHAAADRPARCERRGWAARGEQVADTAQSIARELGMSDHAVTRVDAAARYYDIGLSRLPDVFDEFEDRPEELGRSERELLMSHTWLGYRMLQRRPDVDTWVVETALLHHEWWNGHGYPLGLAQSEIPLAARIVAVADAYTRLRERHPRARAWHNNRFVTEITEGAGTRFDPECVSALAAATERVAAGAPAWSAALDAVAN